MRALGWLFAGVAVGLLVTTVVGVLAEADEVQAYIEDEVRP